MKTDTKLVEILAQSQKLPAGDLERRKADQLGYMTKIMKGMYLSNTSQAGDLIFVGRFQDMYQQSKLLKVQIMTREGEVNQAKFISILDIEEIDKKLKYLISCGNCITAQDVNTASQFVTANFEKFEITKLRDKASTREVFQTLYKLFAEEHEKKLEYYLIGTKTFDNLVSGLGWKSLAFKKVLLEAGMLKVSEGRVYDYNVKAKQVDGESKNTWILSINAEDLKIEANYSGQSLRGKKVA